jgi:hypothetical protein
MLIDIERKIQEVKDNLVTIERDTELDQSPSKLYHYLRKAYFEGQLDQLEAIRNRRFHVAVKFEIHCDTFGSKDFPVLEFDLEDDNTVNCAMKDFMKHNTKDSIFD